MAKIIKNEGARGGHIIGHTKSGAPVYEGGHTGEKQASATLKSIHRKESAAVGLNVVAGIAGGLGGAAMREGVIAAVKKGVRGTEALSHAAIGASIPFHLASLGLLVGGAIVQGKADKQRRVTGNKRTANESLALTAKQWGGYFAGSFGTQGAYSALIKNRSAIKSASSAVGSAIGAVKGMGARVVKAASTESSRFAKATQVPSASRTVPRKLLGYKK